MPRKSPQEQYLTHVVVAKEIVDYMLDEPFKGSILEPSAGAGSFVMCCKQKFPKKKVKAVEIDDKYHDSLVEAGADKIFIKDFLEYKPKKEKFCPGVVIGYPGFKGIEEFIKHSLELVRSKEGKVVFLARVNLFEKSGFSIINDTPLKRVVPLVNRPPCIEVLDDGEIKVVSDQSVHAVFEWDWAWEGYAPYLDKAIDCNWRRLLKEYEERLAESKKKIKKKKKRN